jgi:hypothetical protein
MFKKKVKKKKKIWGQRIDVAGVGIASLNRECSASG